MSAASRKLLLFPLLAAACATSGGTSRETTPAVAKPPAAASGSAARSRDSDEKGASAKRALTPRGQRLWDEALAAAEEQKRLKVPTDWETLERRWRAVTDAEPVPEAWFNVGVASEKLRKYDDARAAYKRAVDIEPAFAPAAMNLALLEEPSDPRKAADMWSDLLRRYPEDPIPKGRLAAFYEASGQRDQAWNLARESLAKDPRAIGAYKVMMRVALDRGNIDLAHLLVVKAKKLDESDPELTAFTGDILAREKDGAGAVAAWKKAIAMKEDYLPARYSLLGDALGKQAWETVAAQATAILARQPDDARLHLVQGVAYRYLGQPDKALEAYKQAERHGGGKLNEVHLARAVTFMKSKDQCEPALAELKRYMSDGGMAPAAMKLQRECEQIILQNKQAEEAAKEMKAAAEAKAAADAKAASGKNGAPTPAPSRTVRPSPTK